MQRLEIVQPRMVNVCRSSSIAFIANDLSVRLLNAETIVPFQHLLEGAASFPTI
jgi:hypothetical protein